MKRGYYALDINNVTKQPFKYEGKYVPSWRHKQIRDSGREVWYYSGGNSGNGRWSFSTLPGITNSRPKPKLIQMLELIGAG